MSLEAWSTAAAIATFVVIAATAVTALVQLHHIRLGTQLSGLLTAFNVLQDPEMRSLINFVRQDLRVKMQDESFRSGLLETPVNRAQHPELYLCDIYNHIGSFVRSGLIDERVYMQTDWYNVQLYWGLLAEAVRICRSTHPHVFENFEYLAARAQAWMQEHPSGDYPAAERRMLEPPV